MNDETAFEADLKINLKINLKITAAHVFDDVIDEMKNEIDFDEKIVFDKNINEADAI